MHWRSLEMLLVAILVIFFAVLIFWVDWKPPATLSGGGAGEIAVHATEAGPAHLAGLVLLPAGRSGEGCFVQVQRRGDAAEEDAAEIATRVAHDGRFELGPPNAALPAGRYELRFLPPPERTWPGSDRTRELVLRGDRFVCLDVRSEPEPLARVRLHATGAALPPLHASLVGETLAPVSPLRVNARDFELPARARSRLRLVIEWELVDEELDGARARYRLSRELDFADATLELELRLSMQPVRCEPEDVEGLWILCELAAGGTLRVQLSGTPREWPLPAGPAALGDHVRSSPNEPAHFRSMLDFLHQAPGTRLVREPEGGWGVRAWR